MKCYVKLKLDDHQEPYWVCTRFGVCRRPLAETKCYYENCHGRQDISDIEIAKLTNKHIEVKPQISAY
jgi:hypothetical protein